MSRVTAILRSRATAGVWRRSSSSSDTSSIFFESGRSLYASFSRSPAIGKRRIVHATLNSECAVAMPERVAASPKSAGAKIRSTIQNTASHTTVPITLKQRCTRDARLAFLLVPTEARSAVTVVPIF